MLMGRRETVCLDGGRMNWGADYAECRTREYGEGRGNMEREEGTWGGKREYAEERVNMEEMEIKCWGEG